MRSATKDRINIFFLTKRSCISFLRIQPLRAIKMDRMRTPDFALSVTALLVAASSALYTHTRLTKLTQELDKLNQKSDVMVKKISEARLPDIPKLNERISAVTTSLQELDKFVYEFKLTFSEVLSAQQVDNETIQTTLNALINAAGATDTVDSIELENLEEVPAPRKRALRGGGARGRNASAPSPQRVVRHNHRPQVSSASAIDADEEEDEIRARVEAGRRVKR